MSSSEPAYLSGKGRMKKVEQDVEVIKAETMRNSLLTREPDEVSLAVAYTLKKRGDDFSYEELKRMSDVLFDLMWARV